MKIAAFASALVFLISGLLPQGVTAKKPTLNPSDKEIIIDEGAELNITCQGEGKLKFSVQKLLGSYNRSVVAYSTNPNNGAITLILKHARPEDSGWYGCAEESIEVKNDEQTTEHPDEDISWIYVYVNSTEPFAVMHKRDSPRLKAIVGDDAVIPCRPTSPGLNVTLDDIDGYRSPTDAEYDPKIGFIFRSVSLTEDNGVNYLCQLATGEEHKSHPWYTLVVHSDFPISTEKMEMDPLPHAVWGKRFTLNCNITVTHKTEVKWKWILPDSIPKDSWEQVNNDVLSEENYHIWETKLVINKVEKTYDGVYTCVAEGAVDAKNMSRNITTLDPDDSYIRCSTYENKSSISVFESEDATWRIQIDTYPMATLKWYKNNDEIPAEDIGLTVKSKYLHYSSDIDHIYSISNVTINDNGNYTVVITTPKRTERVLLHLTVLVPPDSRIHNPYSYYKPGEHAVITCNATGVPMPNASWSFSEWLTGENLRNQFSPNFENNTISYDTFSLVSRLNMTISEMGNLTCRTCNELGCTEVTEPIYVSDGDGFFGIVEPGQVIEGDNLSLICAASVFNYTSDIEWKSKDSEELESLTKKLSISRRSTDFTWQSVLEIRDVSKTDSGNYSCQGVSEENEVEVKYYNLSVIDSMEPYIRETNMNRTSIEVDPTNQNEFKLICVGVGMPIPKIIWEKDGKRITHKDGQFELSSDDTTLDIKKFHDVRNSGEYSCIIRNRVGKAERRISVVILGSSDHSGYWMILVCVLIVIIIVVITYMGIKIHRDRVSKRELHAAGLEHFREGAVESLNPDLAIDEQAELLPYDKKWEFPKEQLKLGKQLGSGAFGVVMKAEARGICEEGEVTTVAVKMVRRTAEPSYMKALSSELKIMIHLGRHLNVVNLLGACTKTILTKRELYVIVEYCRFGNLHNYLQRHRASFIDQIDSSTQKIDPTIGALVTSENIQTQNKLNYIPLPFSRSLSIRSSDSNSGNELVDYRQGIDSGEVNMSPDGGVLSNNSVQPGWRSNYRGDYKDQNLKPICTQDLLCWAWQVSRGMEYLSARNVLHGDLAARNILLADENIVKICDFGLAKNMYKDNNYKKKGDGPVPIKWMAIESIRDRIFSTQSDIWSFGIVLWEFFTLARTPYPGMEAETQYNKLIEGYRMEKPEYATDEIYDIMLHCWEAKPSLRPTFPELAETIGTLLNEGIRTHFLELNTPYMNMNTANLQNGQSDYLTMMSAPSHDFNNLQNPNSEAPPNSDYLTMSQTRRTTEPDIFSPRPELGNLHFDFPPPKENGETYSGPKNHIELSVIPEAESLLGNPSDVKRDTVLYVNDVKEQTPIIEMKSVRSNVTNNPNLNESVNPQRADIVKNSHQHPNEIKSQKNHVELTSPIISASNNYVNIQKNRTDSSIIDAANCFENKSYICLNRK